MSQGGLDQDYLAVTTATTPAAALQRIAVVRPDLHAFILSHPNIYPDLAAWIQVQPAVAGQPPVVDQTLDLQELQAALAADETVPAEPLESQPSAASDAGEHPQFTQQPDHVAHSQPQLPDEYAADSQFVQQPGYAPAGQAQAEQWPAAYPPPAQPAISAPPAYASEEPPTKKKKFPIWLAAVIAGVVVVLAGGGVALWFFLSGGDSDDTHAYRALPTEGVVVDVSTFGRDVTLVPIGPDGRAALKVGSTRIVGFEGQHGPGLAGINLSSGSSLPQWIVPLSSPPSGCTVSGEMINCGETDTFVVTDHMIRPTAGVPTPEGPEEPADLEDSSQPEADGGSDAETTALSTSIRLSPGATEEVPYGVSGDALVNNKGDTVLTVSPPDNYFALAPTGKDTPWIASNGSTLVALAGNDVLWTKQLPDGSISVNGFDTDEGPSWSVSSEVLLIGEPTGILALDTKTGEQAWHVNADVTSWRVDHQELVVSDGSSIAFMEFPEQEDTADEAGRPSTSELTVGEEQTEPVQIPLEVLLDATLDVPRNCSELAGTGDPVMFSQGYATGDGGSVAMTDVSSLLIGGELLDVVAFTCNPREGDPVPVIGVYDKNLGLWGIPDFLGDLSVDSRNVEIDGMLAEGSALQVLVKGEGSLCADCGGHGTAQVTMMWDGSVFAVTRVGAPTSVWDDPTNTEKIEVRPQLTVADLANITLSLPEKIWDPGPEWEEWSFVDYISTKPDAYGEREMGFLTEATVEAQVNGENYIFVSLVASGGMANSIVGGICAITMDGEAICANTPAFGHSFVWVESISVDGDLVTYTLINGDTNERATVVDRFDGSGFTRVSSTA